jgi:hypothetical protein
LLAQAVMIPEAELQLRANPRAVLPLEKLLPAQRLPRS